MKISPKSNACSRKSRDEDDNEMTIEEYMVAVAMAQMMGDEFEDE